jgi:hypothetical protein
MESLYTISFAYSLPEFWEFLTGRRDYFDFLYAESEAVTKRGIIIISGYLIEGGT